MAGVWWWLLWLWWWLLAIGVLGLLGCECKWFYSGGDVLDLERLAGFFFFFFSLSVLVPEVEGERRKGKEIEREREIVKK